MSKITAAFSITIATISEIIQGGISPDYLNPTGNIRGFVDSEGILLTSSEHPVNVYFGNVNFTEITDYIIADEATGSHYMIFTGLSNGDLKLFQAAQTTPLIIGRWDYDTNTRVLTFSFFQTCTTSEIGSVTITMQVDTTGVITSIINIKGYAKNSAPLDVEILGILGNSLSSISGSQTLVMLKTRPLPNGIAQFTLKPNVQALS